MVTGVLFMLASFLSAVTGHVMRLCRGSTARLHRLRFGLVRHTGCKQFPFSLLKSAFQFSVWLWMSFHLFSSCFLRLTWYGLLFLLLLCAFHGIIMQGNGQRLKPVN